MSEGLFSEFLHMEQNKKLKIFAKNPEWKKFLIALYSVAMAEANRLGCSLMDLDTRLPLMQGYKSITWDLVKEVKRVGTGIYNPDGSEIMRDVTPENPAPIDYKGNKTYTLEDLLNQDMRKLTLMCPAQTKQWIATFERIVSGKGITAAEHCSFSAPVKQADGRWRININYSVNA